MDSKKINIVMDVKVNVTVQLGTAELPMKEVVELSPGSQIQLKRSELRPKSTSEMYKCETTILLKTLSPGKFSSTTVRSVSAISTQF